MKLFTKLGCYPDKIRGSNDPSDQQTHNNSNNNTLSGTNTILKLDVTLLDKKSNNNLITSIKKSKNISSNTDDTKKSFDLTPTTLKSNYTKRTNIKTMAQSNSKNTLNVNDDIKSFKSQHQIEPRKNKVILGRGYSLMDWIRYTKETPDLAGNQGVLKRITYEELSKHNKEDDCWLAIYDKVYNVTPYMKFHPGGVEELMKGAGINSTNLFNDVHPWVNLQSMLEKCLVGNLVGPPPLDHQTSKSAETDSRKLSKSSEKEITNSNNAIIKIETDSGGNLEYKLTKNNTLKYKKSQTQIEIPVFDSYQSNDCVNIVVYTKCKNLKSDSIIIDKNSNNNNLIIFVYTPYEVYKYTLDLPAPILEDYTIKVNTEGKIEITLFKIEKIHWWQMCPKLNFKADVVVNHTSGINFRKCELVDRKMVTHDTDIYTFNLPVSSRMCIPIGYHVFLRLVDENMICKPYTVINRSLMTETEKELNGQQICLMIKHYEDGALTSSLKYLKNGSHIEISNFVGTFQLEKLNNFNELILICAGTGLTPMLRLLPYSLNLESIKLIKMLFYNKSMKDILWKDELENFEKLNSKKFKLINIVTRPEPEWNGKKGPISSDQLNELIDTRLLKKPLFCICGPKGFTDTSIGLLKALGYTDEDIHPFLS